MPELPIRKVLALDLNFMLTVHRHSPIFAACDDLCTAELGNTAENFDALAGTRTRTSRLPVWCANRYTTTPMY